MARIVTRERTDVAGKSPWHFPTAAVTVDVTLFKFTRCLGDVTQEYCCLT